MDIGQFRATLDANVRPGSLGDIYIETPDGIYEIANITIDRDGDVLLEIGELA